MRVYLVCASLSVYFSVVLCVHTSVIRCVERISTHRHSPSFHAAYAHPDTPLGCALDAHAHPAFAYPILFPTIAQSNRRRKKGHPPSFPSTRLATRAKAPVDAFVITGKEDPDPSNRTPMLTKFLHMKTSNLKSQSLREFGKFDLTPSRKKITQNNGYS